MIWIESPTNPTLKLADINKICKEVKSLRPDIYTVVDNTFLTCYFQVNAKFFKVKLSRNKDIFNNFSLNSFELRNH